MTVILHDEGPEVIMASAMIDTPAEVAEAEAADLFYEYIDGEIREKTTDASEMIRANLLASLINRITWKGGFGAALVAMPIRLGPKARDIFRPEMIYVGIDPKTLIRIVQPGPAWSVVPDLVAEFVNPSVPARQAESRLKSFLEAGVRLAWVVDVEAEEVRVHDGSNIARIVTRDGELDGGAVLPGFRLSMAGLFPENSE